MIDCVKRRTLLAAVFVAMLLNCTCVFAVVLVSLAIHHDDLSARSEYRSQFKSEKAGFRAEGLESRLGQLFLGKPVLFTECKWDDRIWIRPGALSNMVAISTIGLEDDVHYFAVGDFAMIRVHRAYGTANAALFFKFDSKFPALTAKSDEATFRSRFAWEASKMELLDRWIARAEIQKPSEDGK